MEKSNYCNPDAEQKPGSVYPAEKANNLPVEKTDGDKVAANYSDF